ncbi:hypothetical protein FRC01_007009, partial [Tulasnella sp. 417]
MDTIPTEILIHILSFSIPSRRQRRVRRSLSRVCHFWRTAIYGSPVFWTEVRLHGTTGELQEVLRRNLDGPLDVIWTPSKLRKFVDSAETQRVAIISLHSKRWRSLVLAGSTVYGVQLLLIDLPTPRLINLNVVGSDSISWLILANAGTPLRELSLGSAVLDWGGPRLTGLRCLRLHQPSYKPTLEKLYAILSSSPGLEILDLAWWSIIMMPHELLQSKPVGVLPLRSLTTLVVQGVPSPILHMLLSCVRAPNCRYIRLLPITQGLLQDTRSLRELAKLCQGPLSTVPRLLVSYYRANGSCTITHRATDTVPQANIRESSVKFSRRRGIYLETEPILDDVDEDNFQYKDAGVRRFIHEVVQPSLRDLKLQEIQLDLRCGWPQISDSLSNPQSLVTELLLNVPVVTHLRIQSDFDPMDVLPFISKPQVVQKKDTGTGRELSWPIPLMETLTVACDPDDNMVFKSLEALISKRAPHNHHGVAAASVQPD